MTGHKTNAPLRVTVSRGIEGRFTTESVHLVDAVVSDGEGALIAAYGDPDRGVFPRSSIKLLQALPLVESGAADKFAFEDRYLALACASHTAESFHTAAATEMLKRAGLEPRCLECGEQLPLNPSDIAMVLSEGGPGAIHNNCSGKHCGFLCYAVHEGIETRGYVGFGHPVQRAVAGVLEQATGARHGEDNYGIDGCSIPTYQIPLRALAGAYGKVASGDGFGEARNKAVVRLRDACMANPEMIAGTGKFDTQIMQAMNAETGRVFTKIGAEGVFAVSLPELGIGFALKCHDGTERAAEVACAALIESLLQEADSTLSQSQTSALKRLANPPIRSRIGIPAGEMACHFPEV